DYLIARGIDEGRILREPASETTVQNIAFSRELMGDDDAGVGIVTNDFHVFRATRIARAQGLANAVGVPGGSVAWYLPNNVLRECLGVIKDVLAGNMSL
ncbi:MAG: YdcF family protein, partial [Atopobiaceae bacterium]|nr:YdcF family protein [Atopobiaceae bacterium]